MFFQISFARGDKDKKQLDTLWGDSWPYFMLESFTEGLMPLESQVQSIFMRSGIRVGVGVVLRIYPDRVAVREIRVWPTPFESDGPNITFSIHGPKDAAHREFPFDLPLKAEDLDDDEGYEKVRARATFAANRLSADYARSGFTQEELSGIGEVTRAMKRIGPNGQDPHHKEWEEW